MIRFNGCSRNKITFGKLIIHFVNLINVRGNTKDEMRLKRKLPY